MAEITDPIAVEFVDQYIRPLCELARAYKVRVEDMELRWFDGINTLIPNTADDTISRDGLPTLTGSDVNNMVSNLLAAEGQVIRDVIDKACVRPIELTT
jgi:hypothetical protein